MHYCYQGEADKKNLSEYTFFVEQKTIVIGTYDGKKIFLNQCKYYRNYDK